MHYGWQDKVHFILAWIANLARRCWTALTSPISRWIGHVTNGLHSAWHGILTALIWTAIASGTIAALVLATYLIPKIWAVFRAVLRYYLARRDRKREQELMRIYLERQEREQETRRIELERRQQEEQERVRREEQHKIEQQQEQARQEERILRERQEKKQQEQAHKQDCRRKVALWRWQCSDLANQRGKLTSLPEPSCPACEDCQRQQGTDQLAACKHSIQQLFENGIDSAPERKKALTELQKCIHPDKFASCHGKHREAIKERANDLCAIINNMIDKIEESR